MFYISTGKKGDMPMIFIFLGTGIFAGIMIPTIIMPSLPGISIAILELLHIYSKGSLSCGEEDYISGSGYYRRGRVYVHKEKDGTKRFVSGRVFGFLIIIFIPLCVMLSAAVYMVIF